MPLATYLAVEKARSAEHVDLDDLLSAARMGLAQAAVTYDPTLGVPFGAFASTQINWAMLTELRRADPAGERSREKIKLLRVASDTVTARHDRAATAKELATESGLSLEVVIEMMKLDEMVKTTTSYEEYFAPDTGRQAVDLTSSVILPEHAVEQSEMRRTLVRMISALPEPMRLIIRGIYLEDRPLKDLAEELGVSHPYVSKLRTRALALLREAMEAWEAGTTGDRSTPTKTEFFTAVFGAANSTPSVSRAMPDGNLLAAV